MHMPQSHTVILVTGKHLVCSKLKTTSSEAMNKNSWSQNASHAYWLSLRNKTDG